MASSSISDYPTPPAQVAQVVIDVPSETSDKEDQVIKKLAVIISLVVLVIGFTPFIFMDLYVAYTDTSCVSQEVDQMALTLKDWLFVYGYLSIFVFSIAVVMIICGVSKIWIKTLSVVSSLFSVSWSITGAVLFWSYMNIDQCESLTKNYVYTRLIMSLIFLSMSCCGSSGKK